MVHRRADCSMARAIRSAGAQRMSAPRLSNEFIAMLRTLSAEIGADPLLGAAGVAALLRLVADQLDEASKAADVNVVASAAILIEHVGAVLLAEVLGQH